jgi:predicted RNase H-like nuclease
MRARCDDLRGGESSLALDRARAESAVLRALPKIREVDEFTSDARIFEVHPELSFLAMADGVPLVHAKKPWGGQALRRELLERVGILIPRNLGAAGDAPTDDVLDAAAAAWSASRIALGRAVPYPREPTQHYGSRAIAIWT